MESDGISPIFLLNFPGDWCLAVSERGRPSFAAIRFLVEGKTGFCREQAGKLRLPCVRRRRRFRVSAPKGAHFL